jgi:hypothetical protein
MDVSAFLLDPAKSGYMVAIVGAGAPRFVHADDTSDAARKAAIVEAERLLRQIGRGRALVLRLEAVVDQLPAEFPPATVNRCMPGTVEIPIDKVAQIGERMAAFEDELAGLRTAAKMLKTRGHTREFAMRDIVVQDGVVLKNKNGPIGERATAEQIAASIADEARVSIELAKKAPLFVHKHGIYERRDGEIVGPVSIGPLGPTIEGKIYYSTGEIFRGETRSEDLIREIIVGEEWKPWNGGVMVANADETVDIVTRSYVAGLCPIVQNCQALTLRWSHEGKPDDILAYRAAAPVTVEA